MANAQLWLRRSCPRCNGSLVVELANNCMFYRCCSCDKIWFAEGSLFGGILEAAFNLLLEAEREEGAEHEA